MPLGPSGESALVKCEGANPGSAEERLDEELDGSESKMKAHSLKYASLLGQLMWLASSTRPDLEFAVSAAEAVTLPLRVARVPSN